MEKMSPMMAQYMKIKEEYNGCLLFFRLGDFYEMFYDDALLVSKELQLTLTARDSGGGERAPMCGVPYHARDGYVMKLVSRGYKVAICDQLTDPSAAKGIVERGVIQVVTPGTIADGSLLQQDANNYICSLYLKDNKFGLCFSDVSTGVIYVSEHEAENTVEAIINELSKFSPAEILFNEQLISLEEVGTFLKERINCIGELVGEEKYQKSFSETMISKHLGSKKASGFNLNEKPIASIALGVLLDYVDYTQTGKLKCEFTLKEHDGSQYLGMDINTRRNLELTKPLTGDGKTGSLKWVLDKTKTPMGRRLMDFSIQHPLVILPEITARLAAVDEFVVATIKRGQLRDMLSRICDIERLSTKAANYTINPDELKKLSGALAVLPQIKSLLEGFTSPFIIKLRGNIRDLSKARGLIENAVSDSPPLTIKDGGVIKDGFNAEVDKLRELQKGGKQMLTELEAREKEKTGIPKLRVGYNRVFGYYFEVTNLYKDKVPDTYTRKQTLAGGERYVTPELKELEEKLNSATGECVSLEQEIYDEIKEYIKEYTKDIRTAGESVGWLDLLCSFAEVSVNNNYVYPEMSLDGETIIKDGRHPVVEQLLKTPFVPNDSHLDKDKNRVNIITGPNMAGKSTYMKQIGMITVMAQIGCFVPADSAKISVADALFTRIGASDDMVGGQSTFMVEMKEAAYILNNSTENSLILLDEIGRGTSTFDGMSIAKAILVELASAEKGAKTLFSTHYHELTELENELGRVKNYNAMVNRKGGTLNFLNKIVPGGSDDSYGIDVAKIAGVPNSVVERARKYLQELELQHE